MDGISRQRLPGFCTIYVADIIVVSRSQFPLYFGFAAIDIANVHLISNKSQGLRSDEFHLLQLVDWAEWVLRWSLGLELLAVWLGSLDVLDEEGS